MSAIDEMTPCAVCGAPLPVGGAVCVRCGAAVRGRAAAPVRGAAITAPSAPSPPSPVTPPPPSGTAAIAAAAATAASSAAAVAARRATASRAESPPRAARRTPVAGQVTAAPGAAPLTGSQAELVRTFAEAVGITQQKAARVIADRPGGDASVSRRPRRPRRALVALVIVLAFLGMQAWRCSAERSATIHPTASYDYDVSEGGSASAAAADLRELRLLLEELMTVNSSLPDAVDEPLPAAARRAEALGRQLRDWKRTHEALPADEELAAAGAGFAFALRDWLDDPSALGAYDAYESAWYAWDEADDAWETAKE